MKKITEQKETVIVRCHTFFCDRCGKELGTSQEYDDGYYEDFGSYDHHILLHGISTKMKGNLCKDCKKKAEEVLETLFYAWAEEFGLQKE